MMSSGSRPLCNSSLSEHHQTVWTAPPKKPAGWTKFRETRHPVFRGVRRRGNAGPVQLLAMRPASYRSLDDVRRAVAEAVEGFQRREARADEDRKPSSSANSCNGGDDSTDGEESSPGCSWSRHAQWPRSGTTAKPTSPTCHCGATRVGQNFAIIFLSFG
jgi:hypothetical protein